MNQQRFNPPMNGHQPQTQIFTGPPVPVRVDDVNLKNKKALYELMVRSGWFLPKLSSKFMNQKTMNLIRSKKIFSLMQREVVFRLCCCPPSKETLLIKFHNYLQQIKQDSGIDMEKQNYPDKEYLILCIATLSKGNDEIFDKMYYPPLSQRRRDAPEPTTYNNDDGLLSQIPAHLQATRGDRRLKLNFLSPEEKQQLEIMKADYRIQKAQDAKLRKQKEIEKKQSKLQKNIQTFQPAERFDMSDMKAEIERQAQQFVNEELSKKQAILQAQFDEAVMQKSLELTEQQSLVSKRLGDLSQQRIQEFPNVIGNESSLDENEGSFRI